MDFKINYEGLRRVAQQAVSDLSREYERLFERLGRQYRGRPIEQVKRALSREWPKVAGGRISDPELTKFAEAIAAGTRIKLKPPVR